MQCCQANLVLNLKKLKKTLDGHAVVLLHVYVYFCSQIYSLAVPPHVCTVQQYAGLVSESSQAAAVYNDICTWYLRYHTYYTCYVCHMDVFTVLDCRSNDMHQYTHICLWHGWLLIDWEQYGPLSAGSRWYKQGGSIKKYNWSLPPILVSATWDFSK